MFRYGENDMANPLWSGTTAVVQTVGAPQWSFTGSRVEVTLRYVGPYLTVLASRPSPGQSLAGFDSNFVIDKVEIDRAEGGRGLMTLTMVNESPEYTGFAAPPDPTYEIEWVQLEKKLSAHRRYTTSGAVLTSADWSEIAEWESATTASAKDTAYAALSTSGLDYANKIRKGIESFIIFSPVARKTSYSYSPPTTTAAGLIQTPTGFPGLPTKTPTDWVWLKTADRAMRTGRNSRWDRTEEWTGADSWDTDLYTAAP